MNDMYCTNESIHALIAAQLCGEALVDEEQQRLDRWLESPVNREEYDYYRSLYEARERLKVLDRVHPPHGFAKRHFVSPAWKHTRRWVRYAAVILPMVLLLSVVTWRSREAPVDEIAPVALDIAPGRAKAVLKREHGQEIPLADSGMLIASGVLLPGNTTGTLAYRETGEEENSHTVEMHRLEVGCGGEYKVELPDGSQAWLNSESTLVYPSRFTGEERRVYLTGEAYFEVRQDASKPFIVTVDECEVRVLGTTFNVVRYASDRYIVTTLASGSVEVSGSESGDEGERARLRLQPGEQCTYDREKETMTRRTVDVTRYISWKNGLFLFDNISIDELARQISRWYDVEVRFADASARSASFTGAMERYRPVSYIIRLLNETNTVTCTLESNRMLTFHAPR